MNRFFKNPSNVDRERPTKPEPIPMTMATKEKEQDKCVKCNVLRADIAETIKNFYGDKFTNANINSTLNNLIYYFIVLESCRNCMDSDEPIKQYIVFFILFIIKFGESRKGAREDMLKVIIIKLKAYYDRGVFTQELYLVYSFFLMYTYKDREINPNFYDRNLIKSLEEIVNQSRIILDKIGGETKEIKTRKNLYRGVLKDYN